ncbi:MAG: sugar ABC transporter permease [Pseudomonadota bacterium]
MVRNKRISIFLYLFPALLILVMFVYYPIVRNLGYSFTNWDLMSSTREWINLDNYLKLLKASDFKISFINNIRYVVISLIFQVGGALIFAAMVENLKNRRLSAVYRTTFFLPSLISLTIIGLMFTFIYNNEGLLNGFLKLVGLGAYTKGWLGNSGTAIYAVIAVSQWRSIGYTMMLLIVAIQRIPREIFEAARIDGASAFRIFKDITIPNISGMLKIALMINIAGGFLVFNEIFIMTSGGPYGSSQVLSTLMYDYAFIHGKVGYAAAIANVILVISFLFLLPQLFVKSKNET